MTPNAPDFNILVDKMMKDPLATSADLSILGGVITPQEPNTIPGELETLLNTWAWTEDGLSWSISEWFSQITIYRNQRPNKLSELIRLRAFGPGGDLEVRRDADRFYWRFIGPGKVPVPKILFENYWDHHPTAVFRCTETSALLWGKRNDISGLWLDDRVAKARLEYPGANSDRAQVRIRQYMQGGQIAFTWITDLENC
jgi:hypothetical protein